MTKRGKGAPPRNADNYRGRGKLRCHICNKQVSTHKIEPCPEAKEKLLYAPRPARRERKK